ncbi:hypothetical protein BDR04DRAFT_1061843 [Suillus decipiens]|nr:hypothetical protein BDR04DRAFT_1061843 [Suillus decipiens]
MYTLNCLFLGEDSNDIFYVDVEQTQTVAVLKELIKDKRPDFDHVAANRLKLWKVDLPVDKTIKDNLGSLTLDPNELLSPVDEIVEIFPNAPPRKCLHIIIRCSPSVVSGPLHFISDVEERLAYLEKGAGAPSAGAKSSQLKQDEYLWNRPLGAVDPVPVTLLEPIFARFVDNCQDYQPTARDNEFVWQLSEKMSLFYPDELARMYAFREVLLGYDIELNVSMVGSTKCMHLFSPDEKFVQVIVGGKNEIGSSGSAEPFAEAILSYRKFMEESKSEIVRLRSVMPCIHIIVFGACIGFAGTVFTRKVQSDVLVPIIPLFWHSTDLRMHAMAARTFGALKIAIEELTELYSQPFPSLGYKDPFLRCPYPRSYTDSSDHSQEFSYDETQILRDRLIFFGETVGDAAGKKICIRFVRHYSRESHEFCASQGHAPNLIAYNHLAGGWNMVIMDTLDIDYNSSSQRPGSYRRLSQIAISDRQPLKEAITSLIQGLHKHGYVHGDLRDTNFVVGENKPFMLLDFDWAGPIQETYYPILVNRRDVQRPVGALDGEKIVPQHDLDMLDYIFGSEQDGREPPAKHHRTSSEGSSVTI